MPLWPIHCFQAFVPLFFPFFQRSFCPQKLLLMRFIPGALTLDAVSPEENRTEAGGGAEDCAQKPLEWKLEIVSPVLFEVGDFKKGTFPYRCEIF